MRDNPWVLMRTVRLEHTVQEFKDSHSADDEGKFYEQWDAMEFLLAKNPEVGVSNFDAPKGEDLLYVVAADDMARTRDLAIVYSYNDELVIIHGAEFVDDIMQTIDC